MALGNDDHLMTTADVAMKLRINKKVVTRWIKAHGLPYYRIGSTLRFREEEIDEWIKSYKCEPEFQWKIIDDELLDENRNGFGGRN